MPSDDFNRANGALGSNWTYDSGSGAYSISSNKCIRNGVGTDYAYHNTGTGSPDMYAEADITGANTSYVCVGVRISGALGANAYIAYLVPGSNTCEIGKIVTNSFSSVLSGACTHGDAHKLKLEAQGTALKLYVDGSLKLSATDSSLTTGDKGGFNCSFPPGATYDNFVTDILTAGPVTLTVDNGVHSQTVDGITFPGLPVTLTVADSIHVQIVESPAVVPPSSASVTDDFNRADTASLGSGWNHEAACFGIISNKGQRINAGAGSNFAVNTTTIGATDTWAEADLTQCNIIYTGITLRTSPSDRDLNCYQGFLVPGASQAKIGKTVSGGYSDVAVATFAHGDSHKLRFEAQGTALKLYVDGVLAVSGTDSSLSSGSYGGIFGQNTATYDNFAAGMLVGSIDLSVNNATHNHVADIVALNNVAALLVNDSVHSHVGDTVEFGVIFPAGTLYSDRFDRADSTGGDYGGIGLGTDWSTGHWQIGNNKAVKSDFNPALFYYPLLPTADMWVEATVRPALSGAHGIEVRVEGFASSAYGGQANSDGSFSIYKRIGTYFGTTTFLTTSATGLHGNNVRLRLEVEGSTIRLYGDGVLRLTQTDTELGVGRYVGFWSDGTDGQYDDFATGPVGDVPVTVNNTSHGHNVESPTLSFRNGALVGTLSVTKVYIGTVFATKAYVGTIQVWP